MKQIAILGSTGSIGRQALDIIRANSDAFRVSALCANSDIDMLALQANEFKPDLIALNNSSRVHELRERLSYSPEIIAGENSSSVAASLDCAEVVLNAISGIAGLPPLIAALNAKKIVAAANKESIVCAHKLLCGFKRDIGDMLTAPLANGSQIIPVDSEQCAIFQCLAGESREYLKNIILTASGGMFHKFTEQQLKGITPAQAMQHPTWSMGKKITVDSSTLFNKGLEILEAAYLFGLLAHEIEVVVHPQSVIHSVVRFTDDTLKAQMSVPDMRASIQYAFAYPERLAGQVARLDFFELAQLTFEPPNKHLMPSLDLAYAALNENNVLPIVYNGANEAAVDFFVSGEIGFLDIARCVEYSMNKSYACEIQCLDDIIMIDALARKYAKNWKDKGKKH